MRIPRRAGGGVGLVGRVVSTLRLLPSRGCNYLWLKGLLALVQFSFCLDALLRGFLSCLAPRLSCHNGTNGVWMAYSGQRSKWWRCKISGNSTVIFGVTVGLAWISWKKYR